MPSGRTRMPLTVWCTASGLFVPATDGISALSLRRALEIGSYQDAADSSWRAPLPVTGLVNLSGAGGSRNMTGPA
jgi:hypothetical protein